jgi:hypothetical protein
MKTENRLPKEKYRKKNKKTEVFSFLMILIILSTACSFAQNDFLIVPGERIGDLRIGQDFSTASSRLGQADARRELGMFTINAYAPSRTVVAVFNRNNQIFSVMTANPEYHLANGIKPGSPESAVIQAFGEPEEERHVDEYKQLFYLSRGVVFQIEEGRVQAIGVTLPM